MKQKKITCRLITEKGHYSAAYTYRTDPEQIGNVIGSGMGMWRLIRIAKKNVLEENFQRNQVPCEQ
jgi:hypothetical protein